MTMNAQKLQIQDDDALISRFKEDASFAKEAPSIQDKRREARLALQQNGLPTKRVEAWHYTNLKAALTKPLSLSEPLFDVNALTLPEPLIKDSIRFVFINGHYAEALSFQKDLPKGLMTRFLKEALDKGEAAFIAHRPFEKDQPIQALNSSFAKDGIIIECADETSIDTPIEILHLRTDQLSANHMRNFIKIGKGGQLDVHERFIGPDNLAYETNVMSHIYLEDKAKINYVRLQKEGDQAFHLGGIESEVSAQCQLNCFIVNRGADFSRTEIHTRFNGEYSKGTFGGISMLNKKQHSDITFVAHHLTPNCESVENFKTVADDEAHGVFQGQINVAQIAQKTDAQMAINTLLLSDDAAMSAKPELEIFADDVICAHGATCGEMDEDLLFYLKARGIPQKEAEKLLIQAFMGELIETIEKDAIQDQLNLIVEEWLQKRNT